MSVLGEPARIDAMERRNKVMRPDDEQRVPLAHEIEDATIGLVGVSRYQTRLIEMTQVGDRTGRGDRKPAEILEEWRAERHLRDARAAMERATDIADGLWDEHRRSLSARIEL